MLMRWIEPADHEADLDDDAEGADDGGALVPADEEGADDFDDELAAIRDDSGDDAEPDASNDSGHDDAEADASNDSGAVSLMYVHLVFGFAT